MDSTGCLKHRRKMNDLIKEKVVKLKNNINYLEMDENKFKSASNEEKLKVTRDILEKYNQLIFVLNAVLNSEK